MLDAIIAGFIISSLLVAIVLANISYRRLSEEEKKRAEDDLEPW